jgi:TonB-dependent SusC/RagA subfamily outer membrane receptor
MTMVLQAKKLSSSPFLTALNGNNLKNRIIMMKKKSHSRWSSIKKLMVLPLMILLVSTLSGKEYQYETAGNKTATNLDKIVTAQLTIPSTSVESPQTTLTKFTNRQELTDTLKVISIKNKNASPMIMINGKEIDLEKMKQIDPNIIDSIIIIKDSSAVISYGTKAKDGVIVIKTNKEFNDSEVTLSSTAKIVVSTLQSEIEKPTTNAKPLYIVDDKEIANFNDINPDVIESVTILKGSATAQYGEAGKNGVVFITTKSKHEDITSLETLHKYIARNIKYPMEAHKAGGQAKISLYAEISHEGKITNISETKPDAQVISVDEITVSSKSSKDVKKNSSKESEKILQQEAKRLIKTINKIDIPDLQGKWVQFRFNFILQ